MVQVVVGGAVAVLDQFAADRCAQVVDVATRDGDPGKAAQHACRHFMGFDFAVGLDDLE